jgi:hypothetical protein
VPDDYGDPILGPGEYSDPSLDSPLPGDTDLSNLQAVFNPSPIANFDTTMDEDDPLSGIGFSPSDLSSIDTSGDDSFFGDGSTTPSLGTPSLNSLLGFGEQLGSSLFGTFVTGPAQAQQAQQSALLGAEITSSQISQIFFYGIIALVIYLVFSGFDRE